MTVGHSTRSIDEFIGLLRAHAVSRVVDVRTILRSRHNSQFNPDALSDSSKATGLGYVHLPELGGLRHAKPDSINAGWRNASFRGYADYMQTPEFEQSLEELIQLAQQERFAIMCVEAVHWALSSFTHRRCLVGPWNPRRGHHERNASPDSYADSFRQSPRLHDHLSGRDLKKHTRENVGQTLGATPVKTDLG